MRLDGALSCGLMAAIFGIVELRPIE